MLCRDVVDLLTPFGDEELDPVTSREIAQHVASCAECARTLTSQRALGDRVRRELEYHRAPDLLRARVMRDLRAATHRDDAHLRGVAQPWRWMSAAAAVIVVAGGTWMIAQLPRERGDDSLAREAVSGHIRSLMANHLADVVSTDQHTVKPWFAGKLDFSPPVTDYASADFPLTGGRLDYLQGHAVAALVYMHRKHVINVFVWPTPDSREMVSPPATEQGYHVIHTTHAGMSYWLVSDLNAEELGTFARMLTGASQKH
jgi:anti-sigma factor RsiW